MRKNTIKLKMIFLIFITLIPLSILRVSEIKRSFQSSVNAELESSENFADAINTTFMNFLERTWASEYAIGSAIVQNPNWNNEDIKNYFNTIALSDRAFVRCSWVTKDGFVLAGTDPSIINKDMSSRDIIKEVVSGNDKVVGTVRPSVVDGKLIVPIVRGIRVGNELKGIVVDIIDVDSIYDILPKNRDVDGSSFGIIDKKGYIVYKNGKETMTFDERKIADDSPAWKALKGEMVKTDGKHFGLYSSDNMGVDYPIKEIGWSTFVTTSVEKLLVNENKELFKNIAIFILIYIMSFILAIVSGSKLIKSINKLKVVANEVMNGKLDVKTGIDEKDGLGDVGFVFDKMLESVNRKVKEVEEYNNLKSQFLSTMSHELKTPLNIIFGCIQLLEKLEFNNDKDNEKKFRRYIKMQKQNSFRLLRLINNIIDVNKAEVNHIKISPSNNDIVKVVEDITLSVVEYTKLKNISLTFDTEVEEKIIAFDSDNMERIVLNLLSNAIKFTEENGTIEVNIYDNDEKILISVKDSGIGIPEDKLQVIFERFTQVDNSFRRKSEGSGIGLSLVKSLVELHGGTISVASKLGEGSEFTIELPNRLIETEDKSSRGEVLPNVERIHIEFSDIYM